MIDFNAMSDGTPGLFRFEVYRDEEIRVSSTQFCGGAWSWRLCAPSGQILAQSRAYEREEDCRAALSHVRRHAADAQSDVVTASLANEAS